MAPPSQRDGAPPPTAAGAGGARCAAMLPDALMLEVFRRLCYADRARLGMASREMRRLAADSRLWQELELFVVPSDVHGRHKHHTNYSSQALVDVKVPLVLAPGPDGLDGRRGTAKLEHLLARAQGQLRSVAIRDLRLRTSDPPGGLPSLPLRAVALLAASPSLQHLALAQLVLADSDLEALASACPGLVTLDLRDCPASAAMLRTIAKLHCLEALALQDLEGCGGDAVPGADNVASLARALPRLRSFSLGQSPWDSSIAGALLGATRGPLEHLALGRREEFATSMFLQPDGSHFAPDLARHHKLRSLLLGGYALSNEAFDAVARGCSELETLELWHGSIDDGTLGIIAVALPLLKVLRMLCNYGVTDKGLASLGQHLAVLEELELGFVCESDPYGYPHAIDDLLISDAGLLRLSGCRALKRLYIGGELWAPMDFFTHITVAGVDRLRTTLGTF
eukprot:SM000269S09912  [mRNA]  locus=s269:87039:90033:- [translate_table: standard]